MTDDIAIAHGAIRHPAGGAERVAFAIARAFDAPIYCPRADDAAIPEDVEVVEFVGDRVAAVARRLPLAPSRIIRLPAWHTVEALREHQTVIATKNHALWYIPTEDQATLAYIHTPPRSLYGRHAVVNDTDSLRGWLKTLFHVGFRTVYETNRFDADLTVTNSELVQRRVEQYWDLPREETRVIYPPVDCDALGPDVAPTQDYYLTLGRLHDHKRVDEIVAAFNRLGADYPLVVVGDGPERDALERQADSHIEFVGYVDEQRKAELYAGARAFVMAAENEDFGLTPCEALASGTPVLGVADGYTREQIRVGETGYLWPRGGLQAAVERFERNGIEWSPERLAVHARDRWGHERFVNELEQAVADARERADWASDVREVDVQAAVADGGEDDAE